MAYLHLFSFILQRKILLKFCHSLISSLLQWLRAHQPSLPSWVLDSLLFQMWVFVLFMLQAHEEWTLMILWILAYLAHLSYSYRLCHKLPSRRLCFLQSRSRPQFVRWNLGSNYRWWSQFVQPLFFYCLYAWT